MKKLKVYIARNPIDRRRYLLTRDRMARAGLEPQPSPVDWDDPALLQIYDTIKKTRSEQYHKSIISNCLAHSRAWSQFSVDPSVNDDEWGIFAENDACFIPSIQPDSIPHILSTFFAAQPDYDFTYLGICGATRFGELTPLKNHAAIETVNVFGPCIHAYAMRKRFSVSFLNAVRAQDMRN